MRRILSLHSNPPSFPSSSLLSSSLPSPPPPSSLSLSFPFSFPSSPSPFVFVISMSDQRAGWLERPLTSALIGWDWGCGRPGARDRVTLGARVAMLALDLVLFKAKFTKKAPKKR